MISGLVQVMNDAIRKFQQMIEKGDDFASFLEKVDAFQQEFCERVISAGEMPQYAKAFSIKISNLLIGKYQFRNRHDHLVSSPYALIVDPSNNCPLHCPGCLHNRIFQDKIGPDWPLALLQEGVFDKFITSYGPSASTVLFYNWGEPLLNKNIPLFIKKAKRYLLNTLLSTNLSVNIDAEALVLSGLDYMILSVDGVTKESYGKYRKGGQLDLVFENMRKLVAAKKKYNMATPQLNWQFLLFEHNKHEVAKAKEMAIEIGVNDIRFSRPYDVIWDAEIAPAVDVEEELFVVGYEYETAQTIDPRKTISEDFESEFCKSWKSEITAMDNDLFVKRTGKTCQWLYSTLVMDAHGRYMPCCYVPRKDSGFTYIFADSDHDEGRHFNSEFYRFSRKHFVWLSELKKTGGVAPKLSGQSRASYCVACQDKHSKPLVNEEQLRRYISQLDVYGVLAVESIETLADWNH